MRLFKKLQENSLYWRYRFITSRYLRLKSWWRGLRQRGRTVQVMRPAPRGMASYDPYRGGGRRNTSGVNTARGVSFVVVAAAAWTAIGYSGLSSSALLQLASLALLAYSFVRYW
jgi:hypothetical protein